jgi:hypothetical protein
MATRRAAATDYENFEVGDQVRHPKWGVGSILFKSGTGEATKAIVVFPEHGQKKLLLRYAKLELIQDNTSAEADDFGVEVDEPSEAADSDEPAEKDADLEGDSEKGDKD